jgi:NAD(P)-dependent dehydrogenase (short-subunit alcohol dehydrogenase family)
MRLQNKVALITGAGSGIGRATARLFAREGASVVVVDSDSTSGNDTVKQINENCGRGRFYRCDVSKSSEIKHVIDETVSQYGRLDILHNNAGIAPAGNVVDTPEEVWDNVMNVNLKGPFLGCKYAIPHMIEQGGGSIINTASVNGLFALPNETAYDASKAAVILLTKAVALDFGAKNIRANCICPGITETPLFYKVANLSEDVQKYVTENAKMNYAFQRLIKPEEVANVALFLASDESSGVTGAVYTVDGGYTAI